MNDGELTCPQCNEVHPRCRNCVKLDIGCSFSTPSSVPTSMPLNPESLMDLELLDYCHRRPGPGHDVLHLGFAHSYLLNSILALAALQLHGEVPARAKWYARAVSHQQAALTRAKPHLQELDASQRPILASFAAFINLFGVAEPVYRPGRHACTQPGFNAIKEVVHAARLGRSSKAFVQQHLTPDVSPDPWVDYKYGHRRRRLPDGLDARFPQLVALRALIDKHCAPEQMDMCVDAATSLFAGMALLFDNDGSEKPGVAWDWASTVDDGFFTMCCDENPAALVILAHYAAMMAVETDAWYARRWPKVLVDYILRRLGEGWEELEWPRSVVYEAAVDVSSRGHSDSGDTWPIQVS